MHKKARHADVTTPSTNHCSYEAISISCHASMPFTDASTCACLWLLRSETCRRHAGAPWASTSMHLSCPEGVTATTCTRRTHLPWGQTTCPACVHIILEFLLPFDVPVQWLALTVQHGIFMHDVHMRSHTYQSCSITDAAFRGADNII